MAGPATAGSQPETGPAAGARPATIRPNAVNELDCNGWSPKYKSVRPAMRGLCTDPVFRKKGQKASRFIDNGWYVGHDEPSVKFISQAHGSGNTMTYLMKLPADPARRPTASGSVTSYGELSVAPWFGLPICDPMSYPQNPCLPDSDANVDTNTPQDITLRSYLGNARTLKLNPGDVLRVSITDPPSGFTTTVRDLTTGQAGWMTASAGNGFMNTSMATCDGHPFTFHAEYDTARQQNMVPWSALEGGVLMEQEIGHFEACRRVTSRDGYTLTGSGQSYRDPRVYQTCGRGSEGRRTAGEGPCHAKTSVCQHAETQGTTGPIACPARNAGSGQLCEFADGYCFPAGSRPVLINGRPAREFAPLAGCFTNQFQNGDLDFDGTPYQRGSWPDGTANHPTMMRYAGPFDASGHPYPQVQFETDIGGSEFLCHTSTGLNCTAPPLSAKFYPFWSLSRQGLGSGPACVWNFGTSVPGVTVNALGRAGQYGRPDLAFYGGTLISAVQRNPEFSGACGRAG